MRILPCLNASVIFIRVSLILTQEEIFLIIMIPIPRGDLSDNNDTNDTNLSMAEMGRTTQQLDTVLAWVGTHLLQWWGLLETIENRPVGCRLW